jgi:hypothetical protein
VPSHVLFERPALRVIESQDSDVRGLLVAYDVRLEAPVLIHENLSRWFGVMLRIAATCGLRSTSWSCVWLFEYRPGVRADG